MRFFFIALILFTISLSGQSHAQQVATAASHAANSFPSCGTRDQVGCLRGNGSTISGTSGVFEACSGLSLSACNVYGNGLHYDALHEVNYSGNADRLRIQILEEGTAIFSSVQVLTQDFSAVNQNWGTCFCGSN